MLGVVSIFSSQNNDSLIKFSDLNFKNEFEKNAFLTFISKNSTANKIDLFLNHYTKQDDYNSSEVQKKISEFVSELKTETANMSETKKVSHIFKAAHRKLFKVYQLQNSFRNIFETGEYNCVSGSALYAIIFELMDIPYQIVEAPQHVFLFAYPNTHKIAIETTIPKNGYLSFNENYIQKFTKHLLENKLISQNEYDNTSTSDLFNKYYFAKNSLSLKELVAIQYSNYAIYYGEENEQKKAYEEIKKAYFIFQNVRNKYILNYLVEYLLNNCDYKDPKDIQKLMILSRFNNLDNKDVSNERVKYEFAKLTQMQLITNSDYKKYDESFQLIDATVKNDSLKNEISFIYHYELARLGYLNNKNKTYQIPHFKSAYKVKPNHEDLKALIKAYIAKTIDNSGNASYLLTEMNAYTKDFDFLGTDAVFNSMKANCLLELAYESITLKEIAKGEAYIQDFEKLVEKNEEVKASDKYVEKAYSTAASYYYKKGNVAKTKQILKAGLKHAPGSFGLQVRLNQIN